MDEKLTLLENENITLNAESVIKISIHVQWWIKVLLKQFLFTLFNRGLVYCTRKQKIKQLRG